MLRKLQSKKGFTLIELMIVIAILGVLAAVAIPQYMAYISTSKRRATLSNYDNAQRIVKGEYSRVDAGNWYSTCDDMVAELNGETMTALDGTTGVRTWDNVETNFNPYTPNTVAFINGTSTTVGQVGLACSYTGLPNDTVTINVIYIQEDGTTTAAPGDAITLTKE